MDECERSSLNPGGRYPTPRPPLLPHSVHTPEARRLHGFRTRNDTLEYSRRRRRGRRRRRLHRRRCPRPVKSGPFWQSRPLLASWAPLGKLLFVLSVGPLVASRRRRKKIETTRFLAKLILCFSNVFHSIAF